jgi:hypothetical protein
LRDECEYLKNVNTEHRRYECLNERFVLRALVFAMKLDLRRSGGGAEICAIQFV